MSIKIYNGWRFKGTMPELMQAIQPLKAECFDNAVANLLRIFERQPEDSLWAYQTRLMKDGGKEQLKIDIGTDATLVVYPLGVDVQLLQVFMGHRGNDPIFDKFAESDERFEFYGYWDNTDPDEETTEEEWSKRKEDWEKILLGEGLSGIPKKEGLNAYLTPDTFSIFLNANDRLVKA